MHWLIQLLIVSTITFEYLGRNGILPGPAKYLCELLGGAALLYVVITGTRDRFRFVRAAYWVVFGSLVVSIACGAVINGLEAGPLFAGLRNYLRAVPLFLLPAVYAFNERQIRQQLLLLLALCVIQLPLAASQRMHAVALQSTSGDSVQGTLLNSAILSVFLISAACVLTGMFVRRRMQPAVFITFLLIVLLPTTINETKATLILVPVGLVTVFVAASEHGKRVKNILVACTLLAIFGGVFITVYDYFMAPRWGYGIVEFLRMEGRVEGYLAKPDAGIGTTKEVGRVDTISVPLRELSRDPPTLVFGVGIGNASESALGAQFTGRYAYKFGPFTFTSMGKYVIEIGMLGYVLVLILMLLIFSDSQRVSRSGKSLMSSFSLGWIGVVAVITVGMSYKEVEVSTALSFMFWYFSGLIAAHRMRLAQGSRPVR
jgi:hypothetical protein